MTPPSPRAVSAVDRIVGANLRALRLAHGYAQRDVGAAAGVSFQQMQKYESGSNRLALGTLLALRRFYGIPLVALLSGVPEDLVGQDDDTAEFYRPVSNICARLARVRDRDMLDRIARVIDIMAE